MREIRPSGSEGGARLIPRPYPYLSVVPTGLGARCGTGTARCGTEEKAWSQTPEVNTLGNRE